MKNNVKQGWRMYAVLPLLICVMGIFFSSSINVYSQTEHAPAAKTISKILLAKIEIGEAIPETIAAKVPSALALMAFASGKYEMIRMTARDSATKFLQAQGIAPTISKVAEFLNAQKVLYVNVQRVQNLLRVEIVEQGYPQFFSSQSGVGFSLLRYRKGDTIMYDIPLLHAVQRAFAVAEKDSLMFDKAEEDMRRYPAPTVVPTGVVFKDSYKNLNKIYDAKLQIINAYDAIQVMVNAGKDHPKYTLVDIDTRDSIYAMMNLYGVENNRNPTTGELQMLTRLGIEYIIAGLAENKKDYSEVTLELRRLNRDASHTFIRGVKEIVASDQIDDFRAAIERSTKVLLDGTVLEKKKNKKNTSQ